MWVCGRKEGRPGRFRQGATSSEKSNQAGQQSPSTWPPKWGQEKRPSSGCARRLTWLAWGAVCLDPLPLPSAGWGSVTVMMCTFTFPKVPWRMSSLGQLFRYRKTQFYVTDGAAEPQRGGWAITPASYFLYLVLSVPSGSIPGFVGQGRVWKCVNLPFKHNSAAP